MHNIAHDNCAHIVHNMVHTIKHPSCTRRSQHRSHNMLNIVHTMRHNIVRNIVHNKRCKPLCSSAQLSPVVEMLPLHIQGQPSAENFIFTRAHPFPFCSKCDAPKVLQKCHARCLKGGSGVTKSGQTTSTYSWPMCQKPIWPHPSQPFGGCFSERVTSLRLKHTNLRSNDWTKLLGKNGNVCTSTIGWHIAYGDVHDTKYEQHLINKAATTHGLELSQPTLVWGPIITATWCQMRRLWI
jgi:hypothetical protein